MNKEGKSLDVTGNLTRPRTDPRTEPGDSRQQKPGLDVADKHPLLLGRACSLGRLSSEKLQGKRRKQVVAMAWCAGSLKAEE